MAKLSPPPNKKNTVNRKGAPPDESAVKDNLKKQPPNRLKDMSFKVPYAFWKDYKVSAVEEGTTMLEYMKLTHEAYQKAKKLKS